MSKIYNTFLLLLILCSVLAAEDLYVYYPSTVNSSVVQQKIMEVAGDVTVTVFGKYRDFQMKVSSDSPDVILTKSEAVSDFSEYSERVTAQRSGVTNEEYVLLSIDSNFTKKTITESTTIGVVDFMKRPRMNSFVEEKVTVKSKIKHVTKVEDLLPLLTFKMANAVIITKRDVEYFKKKSNLSFVIVPLSSSSAIASIAVRKNSITAIKLAQKLTKLLPEYIGGVTWEM
jgi:hypothetical protein